MNEEIEGMSREVEVVKELAEELLTSGATWTDPDGETHEIGLAEILIVVPYNAQVDALKEALPEDARVGTVDKFQGQEAPIVVDRLNVATSRARCLAIIIANPVLMEPGCRTVPQMELANGYARVGKVVSSMEATKLYVGRHFGT